VVIKAQIWAGARKRGALNSPKIRRGAGGGRQSLGVEIKKLKVEKSFGGRKS